MISISKFQIQSGESILYRATSNSKWYVLAWKIGSGLVGIVILTLLLFSLLANPTVSVLTHFLPLRVATILSNTLFLILIPLVAASWVMNDIACTFVGEFVLTDQRIWVRGSPYAWSYRSTPLEDIASLTWRRDAIFLKQNSSRKIQVHMFSDGKLFVKAYDQFTGKTKSF
jgi:hypothetical protein